MDVTLRPRSPAPVMGQVGRLPPPVLKRRAQQGIALVSMPFGSAAWPSIQLGTLAPLVASHGFPVATFHFNVDFAARIGFAVHEALGGSRVSLGDWLFAGEAFGGEAPSELGERAFLERFAGPGDGRVAPGGLDAEGLARIRRDVVPGFVDELASWPGWNQIAVVGLSSTFQQNVASFALARRLKQRWPELVTVFGGANFEGDMGREWARSIPVVDYAVIGEAEYALPALLAALADGVDPVEAAIAGVFARRDGTVTGVASSQPFERLDDLPVPDYHEYFERAERAGLLKGGARRVVRVPFESARGCWWGEKRHCTFCGLNGETMKYRSKSPQRVIHELGELARRHRSYQFNAVDNILERRFVDELFPRVASDDTTYGLFYEVKADLSRDQLRRLRLGGVNHIQPGIESLNSRVLALMRKGTRASTNVNLLRWCRYYGIETSWNLLWGFPGETEQHYHDQATLIPHLHHLHPPRKCGRLALERFSPLFEDRHLFPTAHRRPAAGLAHVYPLSVDLERAAYDFDHEFEGALPATAYHGVATAVAAWQAAWPDQPHPTTPTLRWWSSPGLLQIDDLRHPDTTGTYTFEGPLAAIYLACAHTPATPAHIRTTLNSPHPQHHIAQALDEFCARGLMMRDGNLYLALALPATGGLPAARRATRGTTGDG